MVNQSLMRLGKLAPAQDDRTLQLVKYLTPGIKLPTPPKLQVWSKPVKSWHMYQNDQIGDCTCATAAHLIHCWSANSKRQEHELTDQEVVGMYSLITGYNPKKPETDRGAIELSVLKYWTNRGFAGHKLGAFVAVSPTSAQIIKDAIYLFGGIYTGFALPLSAREKAIWDVPPGGLRGQGEVGSWGGHAVPIIDYDERVLTCVTWGKLQRMTWGFLQAYMDEAYALISPDFLAGDKAPNGFDLATLQKDLVALRTAA